MTLEDVLHELIACLSAQDDCVVGWEQIRRPKGALEIFKQAGWLKPTSPAATVECAGCEQNCFMPVQFSPAPLGQRAAAYVACENRSDMGEVRVPHVRLQQWQLTHTQLARWLSDALQLRGRPTKDVISTSFALGNVQGKERMAELHLDMNEPVSLRAAGHTLPLTEITFIADGRPSIDRAAIVSMIDLPAHRVPRARNKVRSPAAGADQQASEVGSPQWRKQTARKAANARHSQPGGSRDKQQRIRKILATGKYPSRDRCAEKECATLGMSYTTARRALRNTPDP